MDGKEEIYEILKTKGRITTSRLAALRGINYNNAIKILEALEKEGIVVKEQETLATYWRLK